ncbi:4'-phosphopantetheinyl transferase superfamily protein [Aliigemmobacter aestuarii]|uniref:4'-phosphopantetheinyl transferase superfamily protein n=1 Tax=Aliigemmobacter aestuarii TaxID=1445661 RepID=A0A4S3MNB2_9RHOB|nr:4'-phosphopantetheinyl transferase superfamily protein [Gemmobacter aestuarii]THD83787.1 4'-phosphopantetheinyl transferase superfamily protein [Gemmobacter aestuarii]
METPPADAPVTVDLWQWSLQATPERIARWHDLLSADEATRAARFLRAEHRDAFIAGRGQLREVLGAVVGQAPEALVFDYGSHGRPALRGAGMPLFNLSHSGGMAALAVCTGLQPGIDIERIRPVEPAVALHHFSAAENAVLGTLTGQDWARGFFRCWTRKEAMVKAIGHGLSLPLKGFDVTLAANDPPRVVRIADDDAAAWVMIGLDPAPGFEGAIALRSGGRAIRLQRRDLP